MDTEHVQYSLAGSSVALIQLRQEPGQVVHATVCRPVRQAASPPVQAAVLLVHPAQQESAPAPLLRTDHEGVRIDRLDHRPKVKDL